MTALAGYWPLVPFDSTPLPRQCERMLAGQSLYAGERPAVWSDGAVALGRRLSPLLPEDVYDRAPIVGRGGTLAMVGDVRLDNRDELCRDLGLGIDDGRRQSDVALLMRAWERWQLAALQRVVGDFALALWDSADRRLVLARDITGQKPLCFVNTRRLVAFASMPSGLHALPAIPYALDRAQLARFLAFAGEEGTRTEFAGIERVPPGHAVIVGDGKATVVRYWQPDLQPLVLKDSRDYVAAVRERLDAAVAARLRGAGPAVGAHLSAGMDSAAVATAAARLLAGRGRVVAFTAVPRAGASCPDNRLADEGPAAAAIAAMYDNIDHVLVRGGERPIVDQLDQGFLLYQKPLANPCNAGWAAAINDSARQHGLSVLLTGQLGNLAFSASGTEHLARLLGRGRLLALLRTAAALRRTGYGARWIAAHAVAPLLPRSLWTWLAERRGRPARLTDHSLMTGQEAAAGFATDYSGQPALDGARARLATIAWHDLGNYNKGMWAAWKLDLRDPTADRQLIETCLRIPSGQLLAGGHTRAIARRVLADRVPAAVLAERRRGYQAADWFERMRAGRSDIAAEFERIAAADGGAGLIDLERAGRLIADWPPDGAGQGTERLYRVALLRALAAGHFARKLAGSNG